MSSEKKMKHKYIFPEWVANAMSKVDMRTQYEASMMSMTLIGIGIIASIIYLPIYTNFATWYKVFLVINLVAGLGFIGSFLVTTYQQYKSYMEAIEFQKELKGGNLKDAKD